MIDQPLRDAAPLDPHVVASLQRGAYNLVQHPSAWFVDHHPEELETLEPALAEHIRTLAEKRRRPVR